MFNSDAELLHNAGLRITASESYTLVGGTRRGGGFGCRLTESEDNRGIYTIFAV
jgi:hypothetical protein